MNNYFEYGDKEINYLKNKDKKLAKVIDNLGFVERPVDTDIFESIVHMMVGQQISTKAHKTIWKRMLDYYNIVKPINISKTSIEQMQSFGMTYIKANNIINFSNKVLNNEINLEELNNKTDNEVIRELSNIDGIGEWTAEMIMLHSMQRKDIFSYKDLAIHRGLKLIYHHKKIDKKLFDKYKKRFSPYGSIASVYIWAVAGGKIPNLEEVLE